MPRSKFIVESKTSNSFKANKVKSMFDCDMNMVKKEFDVDIPIESEKWNIGLIVGASGTGKTTIAKSVFPDFTFFDGFEWSESSIIDDFGDHHSAKNITEVLSKVGFASPPDWLKPFSVLSNGQKMRAELARLILDCVKPFIYDEFTSVVDRQVACVGSAAIQKFVRKQNKQFIAVSCHYDIEEWLEPDWVYDCNKMEFYRRPLRRPKIECSIRKASQREWREFMDFHYLSHDHNNAAHKYICEINGESIAWCSVLHFPHPHLKNMKRIHRIVVKPDYQGIGIGAKFMSEIAKKYNKLNFRISLVTSSPAFIHGLQVNKNWIMTRKPSRCKPTAKTGALVGTTSDARLTATFEYKHDNQAQNPH
jgi:ABC-type lipoprotein export system ATPase subunit/GNAT superfamily N-acetyltransferase